MAHTRHSVQEFLTQFRQSKIALLIDDVSTPERAAIVVPAQTATSDQINFIASLTSGLFFVAMPEGRAEAFLLPRMSRPSTNPSTLKDSNVLLDMCVSVEARAGVTTGISALDRTVTINILGEEIPTPRKLVSPGHIFPVQTREGGLLVRTGLAEGAIDIVRTAGFTEAACYVDLVNSTGSFLNTEACQILSDTHKIPMATLSAITRDLLERHSLVVKMTEARLPTALAGEVTAIMYRSHIHAGEHLALIKGDISTPEPILTRVQTESTFHDVFGGSATASRHQLLRALAEIGRRGRGALIYLRKPYEGQLQEELSRDEGLQPPRMNLLREYGIGAQILRDLGVRKIELLTNTKKNLVGLHTFGIDIVAQSSLNSQDVV